MPVTDETSPDHAAPDQAPPGAAGSRGRTVQYKGGDLEPERGPGLGCFWFQVAVLAVLVVLTPVSVSLDWPSEASAILLFITIGLLLLTGQTIIFLLRLVAAERRGRRRPLASGTRTVGEIEDDAATAPTAALRSGDASMSAPARGSDADPSASVVEPSDDGDVRQ